jgi:hypothetical protein
MSDIHRQTPMTATPGPRVETYSPPGTWIIFAAVTLFMSGGFNVLFGIAALLNDEVVAVGGDGVAIWDFTTWGWILLVAGVVMMLTGIGLGLGVGIARWLAVVFVMLNAMFQFGIASAFPLLAILVIALDIVILYYLTAGWSRSA